MGPYVESLLLLMLFPLFLLQNRINAVAVDDDDVVVVVDVVHAVVDVVVRSVVVVVAVVTAFVLVYLIVELLPNLCISGLAVFTAISKLSYHESRAIAMSVCSAVPIFARNVFSCPNIVCVYVSTSYDFTKLIALCVCSQ